MKKIDRLKGKRKALISINIKLLQTYFEMITSPGFTEAVIERHQYIARGELWITPAMVKFSTFKTRIALLELKISAIRSTPSKLFRENGTIDKRRIKKAAKGTKIIRVNLVG